MWCMSMKVIRASDYSAIYTCSKEATVLKNGSARYPCMMLACARSGRVGTSADVPTLPGPLVPPWPSSRNVCSLLANLGHITAPLGRDPRPGGAPRYPGGAVLWPQECWWFDLHVPKEDEE